MRKTAPRSWTAGEPSGGPPLSRQRPRQAGEAHVVAVADAHVAVVELLVVDGEAVAAQAGGEGAGAPVQRVFVADAAVDVDVAEAAQAGGLGGVGGHAHRVPGLPARPNLRAELAGFEVEWKVNAEMRGGGIG